LLPQEASSSSSRKPSAKEIKEAEAERRALTSFVVYPMEARYVEDDEWVEEFLGGGTPQRVFIPETPWEKLWDTYYWLEKIFLLENEDFFPKSIADADDVHEKHLKLAFRGNSTREAFLGITFPKSFEEQKLYPSANHWLLQQWDDFRKRYKEAKVIVVWTF
jgi:hypothetical protein